MATETTQTAAPAPAVATETAPDAPAPVAADPAQAPAAPANDDGIAAAAAEHTAELAAMGGKAPDATAPAPTPKPGEAPPAGEGDKPAEAQPGEAKPEEGEPKPEDKPAEDKKEPEPKPEETVASSIAKYVRQHTKAVAREKEAVAKIEQLEKDRAALDGERQAFQQSQQLVANLARLATESPIDAIENLLGTAALIDENSSLVADLLDRIQARKNGAPVVSDEQRISAAVEKAVREEREARTRAEEEAQRQAQTARQTQRQAGFAAYMTGLAAEFEANADSFPFLQGDPILKAEFPKIDEWMQARFNETGTIPKPLEVLQHFEAEREQAALAKVPILEKTGKLPTKKPEIAPATKNPSAAVPSGVDTRGKSPPPAKEQSLEEQREEIARRLDAQFSRQ